MSGAAVSQMPVQLRQLYATIGSHSEASDLLKLWEDFKQHMIEDYLLRFSRETVTAHALIAIENMLSQSGQILTPKVLHCEKIYRH